MSVPFAHLFKKTAEASVMEGGVYVEPGVYIVEIDKLKMQLSRREIWNFIVEMLILESSNELRPVGSTMSQIWGYDKDPTPGNVKGFFGSLFPEQYAELKALETAIKKDPSNQKLAVSLVKLNAAFAQGMITAVTDENPAGGIRLHLEAAHRPTKAGGVFTNTKFRLLTEEEEARFTDPEAAEA